MSPTLEYRKPPIRWMIIAGIAALCLHGVLSFFIQLVSGNEDAIAETQRQMGLALGWMIGSLILWMLKPPASRLHAVLSAMACIVFVAVLGTGIRFITYMLQGVAVSRPLLLNFSLISAVVFAGYFMAALFSAIALQMVALVRRPVTPA